MKRLSLLVVILLMVSLNVHGRTRLDGVHNYFDDLRISDQGFAYSNTDLINIAASTNVLEISSLLGYDVENKEDIILFYQNSQNPDYGFGNTPTSDSSFDATVNAVSGLIRLGINSSQMDNWKIDTFINQTSYDILYTDQTVGNETVTVLQNFTVSILDTWYDYIYSMFLLNSIPNVPYTELTTKLSELQLSNGTYPSFEIAVSALRLMNILGHLPNSLELASLFLQAHIQQDYLFSYDEIGESSLEATYLALSVLNAFELIDDVDHKQKIILKLLELQKPNSGFSEVGSDEVSLQATWHAINILSILNGIEELYRPDVLQTDGFLNITWISILPLVLYNIKRRSKNA